MRVVLLLFLLLLVPLPALADAIGPNWRPPACARTTCGPATSVMGAGGHSGCSPGCGPNATCENDSECTETYGAGARCIATRFCLAEYSGGRSPPRPIVRGNCDGSGGCAEGGECSVARRCTAAPPARAVPQKRTRRRRAANALSGLEPNSASGCSASASSRVVAPWALAAAAIVLRASRRRSRL